MVWLRCRLWMKSGRLLISWLVCVTSGGISATTPPASRATTVSATIATAPPRGTPQPRSRVTAGLRPMARNNAMKISTRIEAALRRPRKIAYASSRPKPPRKPIRNGLRRFSGGPGRPNRPARSASRDGVVGHPGAGVTRGCGAGSAAAGSSDVT